MMEGWGLNVARRHRGEGDEGRGGWARIEAGRVEGSVQTGDTGTSK